MISDGFGPASQTMARNYAQWKSENPHEMLPLDEILIGSSRTRSSSSLVTDSAAGATAFSCALKTYNGAIAVDAQGKPCGTVLEAAKLQGMVFTFDVSFALTSFQPFRKANQAFIPSLA
jgi:alkaline phosphatase